MATAEIEKSKKSESDLPQKRTGSLIRVVNLAGWVALVDLWLARHFHIGANFNDLLMLMGIPLSSLWCVGIVDFILGKEKRQSFIESMKDYARQFLKTHLKTEVLVVLYIVSGLFAATFTTVSIDATSVGQRKFNLSPLAFPDKSITGVTSVDKVHDLHIWVNPFALEYNLSIEGYLPTNITVKPYLGTMVIPNRDMVRTPTVLFRPDVISNRVLGSGGWFQLFRKTENGFVRIAEEQGTHAWYIGTRRNQPSELQVNWRLETAEMGLGNRETAILLRRWRNPKFVETEAVGPSDILCALVSNIDKDQHVAGTVTIISRKEYIDLLIGDLGNEPNTSKIDDSATSLCAYLDRGGG